MLGCWEINGRYPIRVKCLHTLIKFSLIIPYGLIKWWISAPRQVSQEIVHLQRAFLSQTHALPPMHPKQVQLNYICETTLFCSRGEGYLLTRGSLRSAVRLERGSKFGASESVRNNNEILHQYLEWQGNVGTGYLEESRKALTHPALISHQIDENSISRVLYTEGGFKIIIIFFWSFFYVFGNYLFYYYIFKYI